MILNADYDFVLSDQFKTVKQYGLQVVNMHSIIAVYIKELRPVSEYPHLFLNTYGRPLSQGEASRYVTKFFKPFGLNLSGVTSLRKVLSNAYVNAFHDGDITQQGNTRRIHSHATLFIPT
jgi:hypothetical protein